MPRSRFYDEVARATGESSRTLRSLGFSVLRLEVNHHNTRAKALYLSAGFQDDSRDILTLPLGGAMRSLHS